MTNGEKLVKAFPDIELYKRLHGGIQIDFDSAWWNSEYKEPTTKNDLVDDCISREQALRELKESAEHHTNNSREEVLLRRDRDIIRALPPVTPQEPKSEWQKDHEILKAYSDGVNEVLDNIRIEIQKLPITDTAAKLVTAVLDKYKAETEG